MKERFRRFMTGRYGNDQLNQLLSIVSVVLLIVAIFTKWTLVYLLAVILIALCYFRMFSRNVRKRYDENVRFLNKTAKIRGFFKSQKNLMAQRKDYHIYTCPGCKQKIRIPRGKGKIEIRCPKCGTTFIKKS